jgi:uncharacterized membrane protein YfcA
MTETLTVSPYIMAAMFFVVAFAYSSVGLGGGSSYTALMAILGFDTVAIPTVTLTLNFIVSAVGSFNFIRYKHARARLIVPFLFSSIPMAYVGGSLEMPKEIFYWILLISLILVAFRIYIWRDTTLKLGISRTGEIVFSLIIGSILGLISGIVGIGGGIYLIPIILVLGLGNQKEAAACGAVFVWLNSMSGLISRFQYNPVDLRDYAVLIIAVLIGGAVGSFLGSSRLSRRTMEKILGLIIVVAIFFLIKEVIIL